MINISMGITTGDCEEACVDYRRVNEQTVKDAHPLLNITATLDRLAGAKWFSCSTWFQGTIKLK